MSDMMAKPKPSDICLEPIHRRVEKPWGWEIIWAESVHYTAKLIHVFAGRRLSLQYHDQKHETQCLLHGVASLIIETTDGSLREIPMEPGKGYTLQPFQAHRLVAHEDSEFVEVSTPELGTTVRIADDYLRGNETEAVRASQGRGWRPPASVGP